MHIVLTASAAALFCVAATTDVQTRRIPNWIPAALGLIFAAAAILDPERHPPLLSIGAAVFVFCPLLLAFAGGKMGGGDVKLLTAAALWSGWEHLPSLLVVTALSGGVLALFAIARSLFRNGLDWLLLAVPCNATARFTARLGEAMDRRAGELRAAGGLPASTVGLPYGVAIAAGGIAVLFSSSGFSGP